MASSLDEWEAGTLAKGVDVHRPDFQADVQLTRYTLNLTSGLQEGIGPRYGFAPLPGHADQAPLPSTHLPGMMRAEAEMGGATGTGYQRTKVFGIYPLRMTGDDVNNPVAQISTYYIALIGYTHTADHPGETFIDALPLASTNEVNSLLRSPSLADGLPPTGAAIYQGDSGGHLAGALVQNSDFFGLSKLPAGCNFVSATPFAVSGVENPCQWIVGEASDTPAGAKGDATHSASLVCSVVGITGYAAAAGELPSSWYGNFQTSKRDVATFVLDINGVSLNDYTMTLTPSSAIYHSPSLLGGNGLSIDLTGVTATKVTAGVDYVDAANILYNDTMLTCNSQHQGLLAATGGGAFCVVFQDWYFGVWRDNGQYVDLANNPMQPTPAVNATTPYLQDGATVPIGFNYWPSFVRGTPMAGTYGVALGGPNSGLLRANTTYEFSFAVFDKHLNYETNVAAPVKIQTGVDDLIGLQLFSTAFNAGAPTVASLLAKTLGQPVLPWLGSYPGSGGLPRSSYLSLNFLEYRFYYRQEGMQEWLPALFIDAPKYWFYPHHTKLMACTGGIGGTVGGRPGGFNDYSPLPKDTWDCVVMYKGRAFWLSAKSVSFSLQNNMFAYAGRNSAACPVGSFKGALVHAYYGQAEQDARIVVFSTMGTYVGKFTGNPDIVPVQVSPTSVGSFPLDGSDFVLNAWTSVTAFSHRSAVVAEGVLYFWGPQGIFMDDGVTSLQNGRISLPLEPDLFGWYDPAQTDAVHCVYNDMTKEITWFYPAPGATTMQALTFNTAKKTWLPQAFAGWVDAAQAIKIDSPSLPTAGTRVLAFSRASSAGTIQRPYFYDQNNQAGDIFPGGELMVKQVATPSAGIRRLTLAEGYSTGAIAVGDFIALEQCSRYANGALATPSDFIAVVAAVGAGTVDITLPPGATLDGAVTIATNAKFFPVWHMAKAGAGINGFAWKFDPKYWIPGGMGYWALWLYLHLVFKLTNELPAATGPQVSLAYRTPISEAAETEVIDLTDNSDGNFQIFRALQAGDQAIEGQGLKISLSGFQLAGAWVLQYLKAFSQPQQGLPIKHFEG